MLLVFIVCEYNPFHNGHLMHIAATKKNLGCDKIICLMSGSIVQRGEIAIVDKYTRATWAIKGGADLVLEIPPQFCLGSAESYAQGAISLMASFDQDKVLSFGSECGNIDALQSAANALLTDSVQNSIKENIKQGKNYAQSVSLAISDHFHNSAIVGDIFKSPNNTLAVEYILAILRNKVNAKLFTIKRTNSYNCLDFTSTISSASAIRSCIVQDKKVAIKHTVPAYVYDTLDQITQQDKLFTLAKFNLINKDLSNIFGVKEGVDNRIKNCLEKSQSMAEFVEYVATKRYPLTAIKRIILASLLDYCETPLGIKTKQAEFVNVLAVKSSSTDLLGMTHLNCVTKASDYLRFSIDDDMVIKTDNLFKAVGYNFDSSMKILDTK